LNQILHDELLDVVNEYDQVIGKEYRSYVYKQNLSNFRVINVFVINSNAQLLIPRRAAHKKLFPLCLDTSVGGHVKAGESYQEAFERELWEELQLKTSEISYKFLAKFTPHQHNVSAFMQLYSIYTDITPAYNPDDFVSVSWMSIVELQEKIRQGEKTKGDLPTLITLLQKLLQL
jgi:isopentenyldiphosphate isomerase